MSDWEAGYEARLKGKVNLANPHKRGTEAWLDWNKGWDEADIDLYAIALYPVLQWR